jgi:hypothetical protein
MKRSAFPWFTEIRHRVEIRAKPGLRAAPFTFFQCDGGPIQRPSEDEARFHFPVFAG